MMGFTSQEILLLPREEEKVHLDLPPDHSEKEVYHLRIQEKGKFHLIQDLKN